VLFALSAQVAAAADGTRQTTIPVQSPGNRFADTTSPGVPAPADEYDFTDAPDVFDDPLVAFESVNDALPGSWIESGYFELTELIAPSPISIVGGEYSTDDGDYTSQPGEVVNGAWIKVSLLSPDRYGATATARVNVGDQTYTFQVTNITETDLDSLEDMFDAPGGELRLLNGEVELDVDPVAPLVIKDTSPDNILFKLKNGILADIDNNSGTANLKFRSNEDSVLETVAYFKPDGKRSALLRLVQGNTDVNFDAAGSLLPINDPSTNPSVGSFSALSGTPSTKMAIQSDQRKTRQIKPTSEDVYEAWIKEGTASIQRVGAASAIQPANLFPATDTIDAGETASFSRAGELRQIRVGSLKGDQNIAGDPLPLNFLAPDTRVPKLTGSVSRLQGDSLLSAVKSSLDSSYGGSGSISFDETRGLVTYSNAGSTYRFVPLGRALVDRSSAISAKRSASSRGQSRLNTFAATNAASIAGGAFNLAALGIKLTMAGSLGYFADLDEVLKRIDPAAKLRLQIDGVLRITLGPDDYVVIPASEVAASSVKGSPAFLSSGPSGLAFRDRDGDVQSMYAGPGDISALLIAARQFDKTATVATQSDGTVNLALLGNNLKLRPSLKLGNPPPDKTNLNLWPGANSIFLRYPNGKVQEFSL